MCPGMKIRHFSLCVVLKNPAEIYNYVMKGGKILGSEKNRRVSKRTQNQKTNDAGTGGREI